MSLKDPLTLNGFTELGRYSRKILLLVSRKVKRNKELNIHPTQMSPSLILDSTPASIHGTKIYDMPDTIAAVFVARKQIPAYAEQ
mgnify:CR=1 FL=1